MKKASFSSQGEKSKHKTIYTYFHMNKKQNKSAFTLIEFILYFAIFGVIIAIVSTFAFQISSGRMKTINYLELQENGRFLLQRIAQEIRNAEGVSFVESTFGLNPGKLVLQKSELAKNPTIIEAKSNVLYIKQGTTDYRALTSDEVKVESLIFRKFSTAKTPENIQIEIILQHINPSGRTEFAASAKLTESVSVRKR